MYFVHFDLQTCFSPQRRAIFQHLNFKKCSETVSFLTFWLGNVVLATAACNFSTSQLQKVLRDRQFFNILTWKCGSRHSGVQFFHIGTAFWLGNVVLATAACNFSTSERQKVVRTWRVLYIFTWKCVSRHNGVQFFQIATWKSGPNMQCFVHFDFKMCFSPQQRAIFDFSSDHMTPHPPL